MIVNKELIAEGGAIYLVETHYDGNQHIGVKEYQIWFHNGQLHRIEGPAYYDANGTEEWWYDGNQAEVCSQAEYEKWLKIKIFQ